MAVSVAVTGKRVTQAPGLLCYPGVQPGTWVRTLPNPTPRIRVQARETGTHAEVRGRPDAPFDRLKHEVEGAITNGAIQCRHELQLGVCCPSLLLVAAAR